MTLWQRFVNWVKAMFNYHFGKPVEYGFWNPGHAKIGDGVSIETTEDRNKPFLVEGIREYTRNYKGEKVIHTAYDLAYQPLGGDKERVRLLYMPLAETDRRGRNFIVLMLKQTDSMEYDEGLHTALDPSRENKPDNGEFQVFDDQDPPQLTENWWRVDDQRGPNRVDVAVVKAPRDGHKLSRADIVQETSQYWDFNRTVKSEGGVEYPEYQFYEMRDRDHYMWGYRGEEIDATLVTWKFI